MVAKKTTATKKRTTAKTKIKRTSKNKAVEPEVDEETRKVEEFSAFIAERNQPA